MISDCTMGFESWPNAIFGMKPEKKPVKSYRLPTLVIELISEFRKEKIKKLGKGAKPSDADIITECVYTLAAQNPAYRARLEKELLHDPKYAALAAEVAKKPDHGKK